MRERISDGKIKSFSILIMDLMGNLFKITTA